MVVVGGATVVVGGAMVVVGGATVVVGGAMVVVGGATVVVDGATAVVGGAVAVVVGAGAVVVVLLVAAGGVREVAVVFGGTVSDGASVVVTEATAEGTAGTARVSAVRPHAPPRRQAATKIREMREIREMRVLSAAAVPGAAAAVKESNGNVRVARRAAARTFFMVEHTLLYRRDPGLPDLSYVSVSESMWWPYRLFAGSRPPQIGEKGASGQRHVAVSLRQPLNMCLTSLGCKQSIHELRDP
jgi:hypothetical protein